MEDKDKVTIVQSQINHLLEELNDDLNKYLRRIDICQTQLGTLKVNYIDDIHSAINIQREISQYIAIIKFIRKTIMTVECTKQVLDFNEEEQGEENGR